jgi:hypothetical protein
MQGDRLLVLCLACALAAAFWSTALVELFSALIVILSSVQVVRNGGFTLFRVILVRVSFVCWVLYVSTVVLSLLFSTVKGSAGYLNVLWHALLYPAVLFMPGGRTEVHHIARAFAWSGLVAAIAGLLFFAAGSFAPLTVPFMGTTTYAYLLTFVGILLMADLAMTGNLKVLVPLTIVLTAIFATTLKAPAMVVITGGIVVFATMRPRLLLYWLPAPAIALLIAPRTLWLKFHWLFSGNPIDRYPLWEKAMGLLPEVPLLGFGPNSFLELIGRHGRPLFLDRPPASWHNDYLQTVLESGWVAGFTLAGLVAINITMTGFSRGRSADKHVPPGTVVFFILLSAMVMFSLASSVVTTAVLGAAFWTLLALNTRQYIKEPSYGPTLS